MRSRVVDYISVLSLIVVGIFPSLGAISAEADFLKVLPGRILEYPRDHASHPEYPVEWWYITGHLHNTGGESSKAQDVLGFQITFFRVAIESKSGPSRWHSNALLISHSAITDERTGEYCSEEHSERAALGMAGAETDRLHVWVGAQNLKGGEEGWTSTFLCKGRRLELKFKPKKPLVLHGERGYVRKGADPGDASYYVSYTRMSVSGSLIIGNQSESVTGEAWFDHEIVSSSIERGDVGWDWFALQLDDNSEVMIYRLRDKNGERRDFSRGAYIDDAGKVTEIRSEECELTSSDRWQSELSGDSYPLNWIIRCHSPTIDFSLRVKATRPNQEFAGGSATGKRYWEGRVMVTGTSGGRSVTGKGYLEMVNSR
jgi:predicted secreted hydrolase